MIFSMKVKHCFFFILVGIFVFLPTSSIWAYCNQEKYLGVTSGDPIVSTIDFASSSSYSSTTTSGTSGCPNWDLVKYLEESRKKFIAQKPYQILEESAQGAGTHLTALGLMMGCLPSDHQMFAHTMKKHYVEVASYLSSAKKASITSFLKDIKTWLKEHPQLQQTCSTVS